MSAPGTKTWESQLLVHVWETGQLFAMCERWYRNPKGEPAPAGESSQLWLPVKFDPTTGLAEMVYQQQWDPGIVKAVTPDPVRGPDK